MTRRFKFRVLFVLLALFAITVPVTTTYTTSYKIDELNKQKLALEAQASTERNAIRVLQAEWAYLAEPSRIERLAALHLKMDKGGKTQVALAKDLNRVLVAAAAKTADKKIATATAAPKAATPVKVAAAPAPTAAKVTPVAYKTSTPDNVKLVLASFKGQ